MASLRRRLLFLVVLSFFMAGALSGRLYQMQMAEGATNVALENLNTVRRDPLPALRGRIVDRRGQLLVGNRPRYAATVTSDRVPNLQALTHTLGGILRVPPARLLHKLQQASPFEAVALGDGLDRQQLARLAEIELKVPGVHVRTTPRRWYPQGRTASHVLGYAGEISESELAARRGQGYVSGDIIGKCGLDAQYDRFLRGEKGVRFVATDPAWREVRVTGVRQPVPGDELKLTLDLKLQQKTEQILQQTLDGLRQHNHERSGGAVVVLDAQSGAVRAMASLPQYDPAFFANRFKMADYQRLLNDSMTPLLDRAFGAAFSPGSTFKLINASASLQEKLCTPGTVFYCGGSYKGANCFARGGHGSISFYDSLALSCDVTYYRLGDLLGIGRLDKYAGAFGLGKATGIDLPGEETGLMPSPAWKEKFAHDGWYEGDTINTSIGQGYLVVTPLQMACYTAAIANGGKLWRPYLLDEVTDARGNRVVKLKPHLARRVPVAAKWLAAVREGMKGAVTHGTAVAAQSKIVTLAGKTGTVECSPTVTNPHGHNHVWFTSFAPVDHPRLVVTVFLEKAGGYGGQYAAPVARRVAESWFGAVGDTTRLSTGDVRVDPKKRSTSAKLMRKRGQPARSRSHNGRPLR
jgi:penicillin-binding protein 2